MTRWSIVPLLAVSAAAAAPAPAAQPARSKCAAELAWVADYASRNYAGFELKTAGAAGARYEALLAELRPLAAEAATAAECGAVLQRWVAFFEDGHLSFGRRSEQPAPAAAEPESDDAIRTRLAGRERLELGEAEAMARIEARGADRSPLEGIWQLGTAYRVAVVRDERADRDYTMVTLRADSVWWTPGQVKATFAARGDGAFAVRFYMRDHSEQAWTARVLRNVLVFDRGSPWFRVWPAGPDDLSPERFAASRNDRFAAHQPAPGTVVVHIPTFDDPRAVDSLFAAEGERIRRAERLVIDVRGNGGGSDFNYRHLLPLIYTQPIRIEGVQFLATPENARAQELLADLPEMPRPQQEYLRRTAALMREARAGWYSTEARVHRERRPLALPRSVAVVVDRGCASSCEQFLLAARQSAKVTLYGDRSAGVLDFANVRQAQMPGGTLVLRHPISRSLRLPHEPVDPHGIQPHVRIPDDEMFPVEWVRRQLQGADAVAPDVALRTDAARASRSHVLWGAGIGFAVGTGVTAAFLYSGDSTSLCDRSANQDAIRARECHALTAAGGLLGAGIGAGVAVLVRPGRGSAAPVAVRLQLAGGGSRR